MYPLMNQSGMLYLFSSAVRIRNRIIKITFPKERASFQSFTQSVCQSVQRVFYTKIENVISFEYMLNKYV